MSNWFHLHSWNDVKTTVSAFIAKTWDANDPSVTVTTDAAGAVGIAAPKITKELGLPYLGAAASVWNDHSLQNVTSNVIGLTEGGEGMIITSLFVDEMEYVDPAGPPENMPWKFSPPEGPVPSGLDTYDGESDASQGTSW